MLLLFASTMSWANNDSLSVAERNAQQGFNDTIDRLAEDFVTVSYCVADPGSTLPTAFEHSWLRLQCPAFGLDKSFTLEADMSEGIPFINNAPMKVVEVNTEEYLQTYKHDKRRVRAYELNLTPEEDQRLWELCDRELQYREKNNDLVFNSCSHISLRLVRDAIAPKKIEYAPWDDKFLNRSVREIMIDNIPNRWIRFCLFLCGGRYEEVVRRESALIIPSEQVEVWRTATIDGQPLIKRTEELIGGGEKEPACWFTPLMLVLIVLLLSIVNVFYKRTWFDWTLVSIQAVIGCLMIYLALVSKMSYVTWNHYMVLFTPLPLILFKWRDKWGVYYAGILVLWIIVCSLWPHKLIDIEHIILAMAVAVTMCKSKIKKLVGTKKIWKLH